MPKKRGKNKNTSSRNVVLVVIVLAVVVFGVIAWHDGLFGVTPIADINSGDVDSGTAVAVKGEITLVLGNLMTIVDSDGGWLGFSWAGDKPAIGSIVVVRGEVSSFLSLDNVNSVAAVWLFA